MIIRIVRMTFQENRIKDFLAVFNESKNQIRNFEGCLHLELWNQTDEPNVFFTYSHWEEESDLENYRRSDLFNSVWSKTKILFANKPQAWSVIQQDSVN